MISRAMDSRPQLKRSRTRSKLSRFKQTWKLPSTLPSSLCAVDDEREIVRHRQKACDAYEEALHSLRTAVLTHIEWETIKTKMEHLESVLAVSNRTF